MKRGFDHLTPKEIVSELNKYIIGQDKAKKAVAIALRNRMRRRLLPEELREEIAPKNIIMIGPTGVGKTEIARRLSRLVDAPFIKVEATKYTEVGYVGRDVESMIRDLIANAVSMVKEEMQEEVKEEAGKRAEEIILDLLLPGLKKGDSENIREVTVPGEAEKSTREKFREKLRAGHFEEKKVEIKIAKTNIPQIEVFSGMNFEEMGLNLGNFSGLFGGNKKKKLVSVKNARDIILAQEMDKLIDTERVAEIARDRVEEMGIVFIDEIDKIASKENRSGTDISREGVQRDILPIVEGSKVHTRYGMVDTSHILFIAAGAFHISKPSDLIPELQGRFPLRVELNELLKSDFASILVKPKNALIKQYKELLKTEGVNLEFSDDSIEKIAEIAEQINSKSENIGARRLYTIMELLLEEISYNAPDLKGQTVSITPSYIHERLFDIVEDNDLSRYIL